MVGSQPERPSVPRAWVIRVPGVFIGHNGLRQRGSFQTIVVAQDEAMAWEVAMASDIWEPLPFNVANAQVFPRDPLPNGHYQAGRRG